MVRIRTLPLALVVFALLFPAGAAADSPTRLIVKREPGLSGAERADIRADAGVKFVRSLTLPNTEVVSATNPTQALRTLRRDDDVVYAELDRTRHALDNDPGLPYQWSLRNVLDQRDGYGIKGVPDADIDAIEAWQIKDTTHQFVTGVGQTVAVVDTGVDPDHVDLDGKVSDSQNFVDPDGPGADDWNGHGTHVAGTIAAIRDNSEGIIGVAPDAQIAALRVLDADGAGTDADIADAFRWAGTHSVPVVNASLGGPGASQTLTDAIADSPGTLFVVAAGNDGANNDSIAYWPCNVPLSNVVCVGASTNKDQRASFSNYGSHSVDLYAPGQSILSTIPRNVVDGFEDDDYVYMDGTSQATPHVAATAALILQANPTLTASEVRDVLLATVDHKSSFAGTSATGGRLNAGYAVAYAVAGGPPPDTDADGQVNAVDACPTRPGPSSPEGCPGDADGDTVLDDVDNCVNDDNANQADADGDHRGDVCDSSPHGPDVDGDGVPALDDKCPNQFGTLANGCVATTSTNVDRDRDGRADPTDGCPLEPAATSNGCPLPAVASFSAKAKRCGRGRCGSVRVHTSRAATVRVTFERRVCSRGRCRWKRVSRKTTTTMSNVATVRSSRLKRGRYRAVVVLSSSAGQARPEAHGFKVR
jgi:thermitase